MDATNSSNIKTAHSNQSNKLYSFKFYYLNKRHKSYLQKLCGITTAVMHH